MPVDPEVVDYVADLARLRLSQEERRRLVEQLDRIVGYVEKLQQLDVSDVPPTKHVVDLNNVARADEPRPSLPRDRMLTGAPETDDGYFVVPKVLPDE